MGDRGLLSRAEALRLEPPTWCHACHALLYAPCSGRLFGRVPLRFVLLVSGGRGQWEGLRAGVRRAAGTWAGF